MKLPARVQQWLSRSSTRLALVVSLLLHFSLIAWVATHELERAQPPRQQPGELWFDTPKPPPPAPPEAKKDTTPTRDTAKNPTKTAVREPPKAAAQAEAPPQATDVPRADAPRAEVRPKLTLEPGQVSSAGTFAVEVSGCSFN